MARNAAEDEADNNSPALTFLSPSTKPGSLGRLAHYEVLEILGRGAFGTVLKAFDEKLHRMVAIKVMSTELAATSPARKRFLREARSSAAVRHENVVAIHAVEEQPLPYLVMEYIPGQTLQQALDGQGPFELPDILRLGQQIASGLAAAHSQGLIHRDIKPANILLEDGIQWKVKITDFGLARAADDASVTQSGMIAGTPMFMSPEQAHTNQIDQRSDLFSFGSVLYQMTSGRPPFRAPNTLAVLRRVTEETPHPIQEIIPETPDWLCTIISKLHEKRPEDRYQTAQEVADLLARCQSELQLTGKVTCVPGAGSVSARSNTVASGGRQVPGSAPSKSSTPPSESGAAGEGAPRANSAGRKAIIAVAALVALVLAGLYFPVLRLQLAGKAQFRNLTRDGNTRIEFLQDDKVVAERVGFGDIELPAGEYDVRITNPDPALGVHNATLGHRQVLGRTNNVTLSTAPEKLSFVAGDRVEFMVAFTREDAAAGNAGSTAAGWHGWPVDVPKPAIAPFDAEQAKKHQEEWAAYLKVPVEYTNSIGMKFRLIPPGEFTMGSTQEEIEESLMVAGVDQGWQKVIASESPQHTVLLTKPYYLGTREVTQDNYQKVMNANPSFFSPSGADPALVQAVNGVQTTNLPVEGVNWYQANLFCRKLALQQEADAAKCRLPTEAEWEFACRAGLSNDTKSIAAVLATSWISGNARSMTHPGGELLPNAFGLFDMIGNVYEWVADPWQPDAYQHYATAPAIDPVGPSQGDSYVLRGGYWDSLPSLCRSSSRSATGPDGRNQMIGFRTVLSVDAVRQALKVTGPAIPESMASNTRSGSRETSDGTPSTAPSDTDRSLTTSATNTQNLPATFTNSLGIEFVKVPKGTGWLGGGGGKPGEQQVEFTDDFYLGKYEVTQAEWEKVTGLNPSVFSRNGAGKDAVKGISGADLQQFPVEMVSWDDCQVFLKKLNEQVQETGWVYRLPTEAEWEYACRGGPVDKLDSAFDFYFAKPTNTLLPEQANFAPEPGKGLQRTCQVGSYQPNQLGLYDMQGNVWEWCEDSPSAPNRIHKGGSFYLSCTASVRILAIPARHFDIGLRLARVRVGTKSANDPDREVAEWVLSLPGENSITIQSREQPITRKEDLPDSAFRLIAIDAGDAENVTDDDLKRLDGLLALQTINLKSKTDFFPHITDQGFRHLAASKSAAMIENIGFVGRLPKVTDESISQLNRLVRLSACFLPAPFTDAGLQQLSLPELGSLHLPRSNASPAGFTKAAEKLPNLVDLNLGFVDLSKADLSTLRQTKVHTLQMQSCDLTPQCLKTLENNTVLTNLSIYTNPGLTDSALDSLATLVNLTNLNIADCKNLTAEGVRKLQLALPKCKIESDFPDIVAVDYAAERKAAEWVLSVNGTLNLWSAQDQGLAVVDGKLPTEPFWIRHIQIVGGNVTDDGIASLSGCRRLKNLNLQVSSALTSRGLNALGEVKSLESLMVRGVNLDLAELKVEQWSNLKILDLAFSSKCDSILRKLQLLPSLEELSCGTPDTVTDANLADVVRHTSLKRLYLSGDTLTPAGFIELGTKFPNLENFQTFTPNPDALVAAIRALPNLKWITCVNSAFAEPAVTAMSEHAHLEMLELRVPPEGLTPGQFELLARLGDKLKWLELECAPGGEGCFTAENMKQLQKLTNLEELNLATASLPANSGFEGLTKLAKLRRLVVHSADGIDPGFEAIFRKARPDVELHLNGKFFEATRP